MSRNIFQQIGSFFGDIGRSNQAVRTYERLNAMSDQQLATLGHNRADVVAAAYRAAFGK
jgi:uncharacterized protein YjiS (DUF1127 family)